MIIDPKKRMQERKAAGQSERPELGNQTQRLACECKVPGAIVGWEHFQSSVKGTPGIMVRFVVLDGPDAGKVTERNFWLTDAAVGQLSDLIVALGYDEPVDPTNDDHLELAFGKGAVMMDVRGQDWTSRDGSKTGTNYEPAWFGVYPGKGSKAWNAIMDEASEGWNGYIGWRAKNPRPEPGSVAPSQQSRSQPQSGSDQADDSIPF